MKKPPVIAIFDIGKTNKKLLLFDQQYQIVSEYSARLEESVDEDGYPCENLVSLQGFVLDSLAKAGQDSQLDLKAVNFASYGASFVLLDQDGKPAAPLYNYLKPYDPILQNKFYSEYGGKTTISHQTASPALGSLNSGLQLYRLKAEKPEVYKNIYKALHLPQYLSFLITKRYVSDKTSIGCHTALWDFRKNDYHHWVQQEGITEKLAPLVYAGSCFPGRIKEDQLISGIGLHDSSAALIPYLVRYPEPFVLLSTGTWSISLNPFNQEPLSTYELEKDCLSYLSYEGKPVKASRFFGGHFYETELKRIAYHFNLDPAAFFSIPYNKDEITIALSGRTMPEFLRDEAGKTLLHFDTLDLSAFKTAEQALYQLIASLIVHQHFSTSLILGRTGVQRLFVDGGFSNNAIYMNLLAAAFPELEVYAASMPQATALGAALVIHSCWNDQSVPEKLVGLKMYRPDF